jgi:hypothetical protein
MLFILLDINSVACYTNLYVSRGAEMSRAEFFHLLQAQPIQPTKSARQNSGVRVQAEGGKKMGGGEQRDGEPGMFMKRQDISEFSGIFRCGPKNPFVENKEVSSSYCRLSSDKK